MSRVQVYISYSASRFWRVQVKYRIVLNSSWFIPFTCPYGESISSPTCDRVRNCTSNRSKYFSSRWIASKRSNRVISKLLSCRARHSTSARNPHSCVSPAFTRESVSNHWNHSAAESLSKTNTILWNSRIFKNDQSCQRSSFPHWVRYTRPLHMTSAWRNRGAKTDILDHWEIEILGF